MTLLNKFLLILLGLTIVGAVGFIIYQQHQMSTMQTQINTSMVAQKVLLDGITRSQAQYATKQDLDAFAAANGVNLAAIQKDVSTLNASITGMNNVVVNSGGNHQNNVPSTSTTPNTNPNTTPTVDCNGQQIPCPNADPYAYQKNVQTLQLTEPFGSDKVPIGSVSFSAFQKDPWSVDTLPRAYDISNVIATDQDGRQFVYNQFTITTGGKTYKLPVTSGQFVQQYPSPSFSFWNPRIYLGVDVSAVAHVPVSGELIPNLSFGFMSYGKSKVTPDWSFVQVGVGYGTVGNKVQFQLSPVQYNIGQHLPFMKNTFIGPAVGVSTDGSWNVGAGLRVGL